MPRLLRLRFMSVGHPLAHMDDVTLDFRDSEGRPTDSTIWLRNGGGKSSILSLFFAMLRPNRNEFIGGKAESGQRQLEDYVERGERGVVAAEWELDASTRALDLGAERFLTGVFLEHGDGAGGFKRFYFASKVADDISETQLEGIPFHTVGSDGRRVGRRTLAAFRMAWRTLRDRAPHLNPSYTESQREWQEILDGAGIDTELYAYQVRMNLREGGADDLFRFSEPENFIDFLLELALDSSLGEGVSRNIATFREDLVRRSEQYIPERELVAGLLERFRPLEGIVQERSAVGNRLAKLKGSMRDLDQAMLLRIEALVSLADRAEGDRGRHAAAAREQRQLALSYRVREAVLLEHAARQRLEGLRAEIAEVNERHGEVQRQARVWEAAIPLRDALKAETSAQELRRQLEQREEQHAPLLDQLREVARPLAARLKWRLIEIQGLAAEQREAEADARREARERTAEAIRADQDRVRAETRAQDLEQRLAEVQQARQRLVQENTLKPEERAAEALERWDGIVREAGLAIEGLTGRGQLMSQHMEDLAGKLVETERRLAQAEGEVRQIEQELEAAQVERRKLEEDTVLQTAITLESPDLERMGNSALGLLEGLARQEQEKALEARLAQAQDQRGSVHIEEHGLLPPSPDVQRLLDILNLRLGVAWSGWDWIANNVAKENALNMVRQVPHLAQGIVVRPGDLERAVGVLETEGAYPDGPVVLAETSALEQPHALRGAVVGPTETAWFDRASAQQLLGQMQERLASLDEQATAANRMQREFLECRSQLVQFRQRYPTGWFAQTGIRLEQAQANLKAISANRETLTGEQLRLVDERQRLEVELAETRQRLNNGQLRRGRVKDFQDDREIPAKNWAEELSYARQDQKAAELARREQSALAETAEQRAEEAAKRVASYVQDASQVDTRLRTALLYAEDPEPEPGPIDTLQDRYSNLKMQYEGKLDAQSILPMIAQHEYTAQEERESLQRLLTADLTEEAVREALTALPDSRRVESERRKAEDEAASLGKRLGTLTAQENYALQELEKARDRCMQYGSQGDPEPMPSTPELADTAAEECVAQAIALEAAAQEEEEAAAQADAEARKARQDRGDLEGLKESLETMRQGFSDLLERVETGPGDVEIAALDPLELREQLRQLGRGLGETREAWSVLDHRQRSAAQAIRGWLALTRPRLQEVEWMMSLQERSDAALEEDAVRLSDQLQLRLQQLTQQIESVERHRSVLLEELLAVSDEGLRLLDQANNLSRLPDGLPHLGGAQFLRINPRTPDDPDERRGRIGQLVDELAAEDRKLSGVALVQATVRRLAQPITVRVLHPDPTKDRRMVDISAMPQSSGGEHLTAAILLYCTLARLRARSRGTQRHPSSVLVLDNPIGRVSRARFLELQREVARFMNIQLVYTTGVNDYEALGVLPNVIRLRNERYDRRHGHRLLEQSLPHNLGLLEGVRIGRDGNSRNTTAGAEVPIPMPEEES